MSDFEEDYTRIFMRGICLISEGEYEAAVELLDRVIDMEPVFADAYAQRGYAKFHLNRIDDSLEDLNLAIEFSPQSVDAFAFRARSRWVAGDYQNAFEDVSHAIELDPNNVHALHVRAFVNMEIDNQFEAIDDFDRILEISPGDQHAIFMRAWAKLGLGRPEEARTDNDRLQEADPYDARYLVQQAVIFGALERYDDALASAEKAIREHYEGKRPPEYYMGCYLLSLGRFAEALTRFGESLEKDMTYQPLYGMAVALGRLGRIDECRDKLVEATRAAFDADDSISGNFFRKQQITLTDDNADSLTIIEPEVALPFWHKALAAQENEDHEAALRLFSEAVKRNPLMTGGYANMAAICQELERYEEAHEAIEKALELCPGAENYLYRKGMILIDRDMHEEASKLFDSLIEQSPDEAAHYYQRARARYLSQDVDGAIDDLNTYCLSEPNSESALLFRATCYRIAEQFDKAVEDYSRVIYYHPGHIGALHSRAVVYEEELEKYEEAIRDETQAVENDPEFQPAWLLRGRAWGDLSLHAQRAKSKGEKLAVTLIDFFSREFFDVRDCLEHAVSDLTRAIELAPDDLEAVWVRGYYRYRAEDYPGTLEDFAKIVERDQTHPSAYHWMGWANISLGKYPEAVEAFDKALATNPEDGDTYYARGIAKQNMLLFAESEEDMNAARRLDPDDAFAVHYLAHALEWQGRFEESLSHFAKSLEMRGDTVEWYCCHADVLIKLGRLDEAVERINASIAIDPQQSQPYFYLGELYERLGEQGRAAENYALAVRSEDPALRSSRESEEMNLVYRARAFAGLGRHEEAVARYLEAIEKSESPEMKERDRKHHAYWLAESYYALGRFGEAMEQYRVALDHLQIYHDREERICRCRERLEELEAMAR